MIGPCNNIYLFPFLFSFPQNISIRQQPIEKTAIEETPKTGLDVQGFSRLLEEFVQQTGGASQMSRSRYARLPPKYSPKKVLRYEEFKELYLSVLNKYRSYYPGSKKKRSWGKQDLNILVWIVRRLSRHKKGPPEDFEFEDWHSISRIIPFRTPEDCKFKWLSMGKNALQTNPWTLQENEALVEITSLSKMAAESEPDWQLVSQSLFQKFPRVYRTPKQCRENWNIKIKSHNESKKLWSSEQDATLINSYRAIGKKWKAASEKLPGRSQNAIKNRFSLLVNKDTHLLELPKLEKIENQNEVTKLESTN